MELTKKQKKALDLYEKNNEEIKKQIIQLLIRVQQKVDARNIEQANNSLHANKIS